MSTTREDIIDAISDFDWGVGGGGEWTYPGIDSVEDNSGNAPYAVLSWHYVQANDHYSQVALRLDPADSLTDAGEKVRDFPGEGMRTPLATIDMQSGDIFQVQSRGWRLDESSSWESLMDE